MSQWLINFKSEMATQAIVNTLESMSSNRSMPFGLRGLNVEEQTIEVDGDVYKIEAKWVRRAEAPSNLREAIKPATLDGVQTSFDRGWQAGWDAAKKDSTFKDGMLS